MCEDPNDSLWKSVLGTAEVLELEFQKKNHFCPLVVTEQQESLVEVWDNTHNRL